MKTNKLKLPLPSDAPAQQSGVKKGVAKKAPLSVEEIERQAHELASREKWAQAARVLWQAARREPESARFLQIARWQRLGREPKAAIKTLRAALRFVGGGEQAPDDVSKTETDTPLSKNVSHVDSRLRQTTDSSSSFDEGVLRQALAEAQLETQDWDGAIETCRELLSAQPRHHFGREMLATALLHSGRIDDATAVMRELLVLSPRDPLHRLKFATLLQLQGKSGESSREFQRVADSYPNAPFVDEAHEAIETLDHIQIQQVLMRATTETEFREQLEHAFEAALPDNGFHLSEAGRESLRHILGDGQPDYGSAAPPRVH